MPLDILYSDSAVRSLQRIDRSRARAIVQRVERLADHSNELTHAALKGRFRGLLKLRVGDYRVTYTIERDAGTLTVHLVGHRSEIYDITMEDDLG